MASSGVTPSIGLAEPAFPEPVVERTRISLPPPLDSSQSSQVNLLDVAPMDFLCGVATSGDLQTILPPTILDSSSCLAPNSAPEIETIALDDTSDDTELFLTRHVTYSDNRLPSGPVTSSFFPDASDKVNLPSVDSDDQFTPCEVLLGQNIQSHGYKAGTPEPALSSTFSAPLTPLLTADTLARDSSPLLSEPNSDVFMHSSPPLSSPQIECNVTVIGDLAGDREDNRNGDHARIDCYPAMTMSSPNFTFHEDEYLFSPSPPHQTTAAKRALFDDTSDEVRCQRRTCSFIKNDTGANLCKARKTNGEDALLMIWW
jgi:hypothetical protein